jgi:penicillin-binding protein 2
MEPTAKNRFAIYGFMLFAMFLILIFNLFKLTVVEGERYLEISENRKLKTVAIQGTRGSILDRKGLPLAYDEKSYNVTVVKDPTINSTSARAYYSDIFIDTIEIVEKYGGDSIDRFVIQKDEKGNFFFDFGISNVEASKRREENWRKNMFVGYERTPEEIYVELRARFLIPQEYSYEQSRKLLSIWQEVQLSSYRAYVPVIIAENVDIYTVSEVETRANELEGVSVQEGTIRTYVQDDVAAHLIGYLGKINTPELGTEMSKRGYELDDLIGISGVEQSLEAVLTGNNTERQGTQLVEVNSRGAITKVLTSTPAKQGNSLMLTIDLQLQMAVEESLKNNVKKIREQQEDLYIAKPYRYNSDIYNKPGVKSNMDADVVEQIESIIENGGRVDWNKYNWMEHLDLADSGAAVVMDVNNGDILAIASYPSFDLNLFTGGISEKNYRNLSLDKSNPLFNKAVYTKATPGSIIKMSTGLGALMTIRDEDSPFTGSDNKSYDRITLDTRVSDVGYYDKYTIWGNSKKCWHWTPNNPAPDHQQLNITDAIAGSCNYFFYTCGDYQNINNLNYWSNRFGLTAPTGIELIGEPIGQIGSQRVLFDNTRSVYDQDTSIPFLVHRLIRTKLRDIAEFRGVAYSDEVFFETASRMLSIIDDDYDKLLGPEIRRVLSEQMNISSTMSRQRLWDKDIASIMTELQWSPSFTLATAIGQGQTAITPLAAARYTAAVVNGGIVYNVHVVDKILSPEGEVIEEIEPSIYGNLDDVPSEYLEALKEGMRDVISSPANPQGTAYPFFEDFEYAKNMGGKTGTAEISVIDLENNSWFVSFAPYNDPEIAIVTFVANGYKGDNSSIIARDIIKFYIDKQKEAASENIPEINDKVS